MKKVIVFIGFLIAFQSFSQPAEWKVVNYTNSTTTYGVVNIRKDVQVDTGDKVGAFISKECRAIGDVIMNSGKAYVTLQIQGEKVEWAHFKIWDKSTDKIWDCPDSVQTSPGGIIGYPPNYAIISHTLDVSRSSDFKVFPNPFSTEIRIMSSEEINKVILFNISGQKIIEKNRHFNQINTMHLPKGSYYLILLNKERNLFEVTMIKN